MKVSFVIRDFVIEKGKSSEYQFCFSIHRLDPPESSGHVRVGISGVDSGSAQRVGFCDARLQRAVGLPSVLP